ncbi:cell division regulator GpsB [Ureibacillus sp. Re31]|uniref:Cell division regulator GpsB n=1 Tax=Ureibacillus galli TaxID=2762222 RepID=A0ABR8X791_9BACL|nr:cell division regulator GpsB [Ureibacillus galli]MBD8025184.1 cell division regulator GpsB [Ureibacillus galli]
MEIKLNSKIILEKEFKKVMKGYSIDQVDQFLDQIMEDYDVFEKVVEELEELRAENKRLKEELENSAARRPQVQQPVGNTNFDILKRLSNLEKHVFGSKLYE